jgi:hypothetical protein
MFFVKPEVSVTQNFAQNSGPKFRLLIPAWIREKFYSDFWSSGRALIFCSSFLACLKLEPRTFWAQSQQRRPTNQAANWFERKNAELSWCVTHWPMPEIFRWKSRSFVLSLYILPKTKLQVYWDWLERFVDFLQNFSWIIGSFGEFFRTECFGSKNPKSWITVFVRHFTSTKIVFRKN